MPKVLVAVFSRDKNLPFLERCIEHINASLKMLVNLPTFYHNLLIIDFGSHPSKTIEEIPDILYYYKPNAGFCKNFNAAREIAFFMGYNYLATVNDDAFISERFLFNGIDFLEKHSDVGFVGGIPNGGGPGYFHEPARWNMPIESYEMPKPTEDLLKVDPLDRLWWEASAGCYRVKALEDVGRMDEEFDRYSGVVSDNDYFFRMQESGWSMYRSGAMRFWHARGITQNDFRNPSMGEDELLRKAKQYFEWKHHVKP